MECPGDLSLASMNNNHVPLRRRKRRSTAELGGEAPLRRYVSNPQHPRRSKKAEKQCSVRINIVSVDSFTFLRHPLCRSEKTEK
ncbi:hypothetical protein QJS04_geneDACA015924 [Acorus gramineus]|uniref:Uncharacterized protein n=1 Tax=Acorus gramineus TaxID=55184 RepID=A0AAV9BI76_ACOGR|nr:hypothetical protein QJS04_geneDACA015924 [Acorus gramineus]